MEILKHYRRRLACEGWIQALLCGLIVGFTINTICSIVFLFVGVKMLWLGIVGMIVGIAISTPIFYYTKFYKNKREVAARVDAVGLEERVLTMTQLEKENSFIAKKQREDTIKALNKINKFKIAISIPLVICVIIALIFSVCFTTLAFNIDEPILENYILPVECVYFDIEYEAQDGGRIDGDVFQRVAGGSNADPVQAVADDGYVFVGWSDEYENDYRTDFDVSESIKVYAIFMEIEDGDENSEEEGEGADHGTGNQQQQAPSDDPGQNSPDGSGDGMGGSSNQNNQIIDGGQYYGDHYGSSLADAQGAISSGNMSDGDVGVVGGYFNNIAK